MAERLNADVDLLDRIVRRDASAIAELYDRHSRVVYGVILRIVRDSGDAEDVLQEVFFRVWERAETYDRVLASPVAWLVRIGRNRAIDRIRARQARPVTESAGELLEQLPDPVGRGSQEQQVRASEEQQAIAHALSRLAPEQRVLIEAAYFKGYTQSELATTFRLPLGTVKTRIRTGMLAMREHLQHMV